MFSNILQSLPMDQAVRKRLQQSVFWLYALVASVYCGGFSLLYFFVVQNVFLGWIHLIGLGFVGVSWAVYRFTDNLRRAISLILLDGAFVVLSMFVDGGWGGSGLFWVFGYLPYATLLTTKKQAFTWVGVLFGGCFLFEILNYFGVLTLPYPPVARLNFFLCYLVIALCIFAYKIKADQGERTLGEEHATVEVERAKDEAVLASIGEGVFVLDMAGRLVYANQAACETLRIDFPKVYLSDKSPIRLYKADGKTKAGEHERPVTRLLRGDKIDNELFFVAYPGTGEDGVYVVVTGRLVVDSAGCRQGMVIIFRDVSQEERINRAKSEFITLASEQLRTPLSLMGWYTELLLGTNLDRLDQRQQNYLQEIKQASERMQRLGDVLLNASKLELGAFVLNVRPLHLGGVVKRVMADLAPLTNERRVEIREEVDPSLPRVMADPRAYEIILHNLLSNAVKYSLPHTVVRLKVAPVRQHRTGEMIRIVVSDQGVGIPLHQQSHIFTKLFRAENAVAQDGRGLGLGLYMVKLLVDRADGAIRFESVEDRGTTFYVDMPMQRAVVER